MDALLTRLLTALRTVDPGYGVRRPAPRRVLTCDVLEGRQLLSAGFGGPSVAAGHPWAHASAHRGGGHAHFGRLRMSGPYASVAPAQAAAVAAPQTPLSPAPQAPPVAASASPATGPTADASQNTAAPQAQGAPAAQGTVAPAGQQAVAPNPQLTADLQTLRTDEHGLLAKSQVTVAQSVALQDDLRAIDKASTSAATQATLKTFQDEVKSIGATLPTADRRAKLVSDFTDMVKSRGVTDQTLIDKTVADAEAIVTASGVTADDLARLTADRTAIKTDLDASAPAGAPDGPGGGFSHTPGLGRLLAGAGGESGRPGTGGSPGFGDGGGGGVQEGSWRGRAARNGPDGQAAGLSGNGASGDVAGAQAGVPGGSMGGSFGGGRSNPGRGSLGRGRGIEAQGGPGGFFGPSMA